MKRDWKIILLLTAFALISSTTVIRIAQVGGLQTALNGKVDNTTTVNGHPLSSNVTVSYSDLGTVPIASGGTNIIGYTTGDILYASATNVLSKLAIGTSANILVINGGLPSWQVMSGDVTIGSTGVTAIGAGKVTNTMLAGSISNANLANSSITINGTSVSLGGTRTLNLASGDFVNQGTTTTVLHGNASGNPSFGAVSLVNDITGTLAETHGGTNQATYTTGDIIYASATNTLSKLGIGSTNQVLTIVGGVPTWVTPSGGGGGSATPGGSVENVQFNRLGALTGTPNFGIDSITRLPYYVDTTVGWAARTGKTGMYANNNNGISTLNIIPSVGNEYSLQADLGLKVTSMLQSTSNGTNGYGYLPQGIAGTGASTADNAAVYDATNMRTNYAATRFTTATTSGSSAGERMTSYGSLFGNNTYGGGVKITVWFSLSTYNANERIAIGFTSSASTIGNVDPSSLTNVLLLAKDVGDATLQFMVNDGTSTCTKTNTSITPNQNDVYKMTLTIPSNATVVYCVLDDYSKSAKTTFKTSFSTNLPAAGAYLYQLWTSNGATAAARAIDRVQTFIENY